MAAAGITLHQYRVFLKAAELGSISRAANALSVPQPSISRAIARIETHLGVSLVERHRSGIRTTPAGERFRTHAGEALRQIELAGAAAQQEQAQMSGEIRFAAPESVAGVIFRPLVQSFRHLYPAARIRVLIAASAHLPSLMDNSIVDLGIVADTHPLPTTGAEALCQENLYLIGPSTSTELSGSTISLNRAAGLPLYLNAMPGGFRTRIDEAFQRRGLRPDVLAEIDANEPLLELILDEGGYTILPYSSVARSSRRDQFRAARIVAPQITRKLKLVAAGRMPPTPIGRETARLVRRIVGEQASAARWRLSKPRTESNQA